MVIRMVRFRKATARSRKSVQKVQIVKKKRKRRKRMDVLVKKKYTTVLKYVDVISINPGAAATTSHIFKCNGIFDPDTTSTGHQPLFRDELAALYAEYRVVKSRIKVTPITSGTANVLPAFWGVYMDNNDAALTYTLATYIRNYGK